MNPQLIPRILFTSSLRVARLPLDIASRLGGDAATPLKLAVDRADAGLRGAAGGLLGDEVLMDDAERRRLATDERERAMHLRSEAELRDQRGDQAVERAEDEGERRKKQASSSAKRKAGQARKRSAERKSQAAKEAGKRKQAARSRASQREKQAEDDAKRDRLEAVKSKGEALEVKEAAVRAAEEARRLEKAASAAKAERRSNGGG